MTTPQEARREDILERSKDRLKRDIEKEITKLFDQVLDISEVAIGDAYRYKSFRAKVLRSGNDAIREVKKLLDRNYAVEFIPSREDIIEVQSPPTVIIRKQN
jgi:hypothetical protein